MSIIEAKLLAMSSGARDSAVAPIVNARDAKRNTPNATDIRVHTPSSTGPDSKTELIPNRIKTTPAPIAVTAELGRSACRIESRRTNFGENASPNAIAAMSNPEPTSRG